MAAYAVHEALRGLHTPGAGCTEECSSAHSAKHLRMHLIELKNQLSTAAAAALPSLLHSGTKHVNNSRRPRTTTGSFENILRFFSTSNQPCWVAGCALSAAQCRGQTPGAGCTDEAAARTPRNTRESMCSKSRLDQKLRLLLLHCPARCTAAQSTHKEVLLQLQVLAAAAFTACKATCARRPARCNPGSQMLLSEDYRHARCSP
jgi:hypothetical protein